MKSYPLVTFKLHAQLVKAYAAIRKWHVENRSLRYMNFLSEVVKVRTVSGTIGFTGENGVTGEKAEILRIKSDLGKKIIDIINNSWENGKGVEAVALIRNDFPRQQE